MCCKSNRKQEKAEGADKLISPSWPILKKTTLASKGIKIV